MRKKASQLSDNGETRDEVSGDGAKIEEREGFSFFLLCKAHIKPLGACAMVPKYGGQLIMPLMVFSNSHHLSRYHFPSFLGKEKN